MASIHFLPAISFAGDAVSIRIYPNADILAHVSRKAALHLYSLLARYNATTGRKSWSGFWQHIEQIERCIVVLFVKANQGGHFGHRLHIDQIIDVKNQADDFAKVYRANKRLSLRDEVKKEWLGIYGCYVRAMVSEKEIRAGWEATYPQIVALLKTHGKFEQLFEESRCYDSDYVAETVAPLLTEHGYGLVQVPKDLAEEIPFSVWAENDADLFANVVRTLLQAKE